MAWVRYRYASVSATNPQALGTCDRCGMTYQHNQLAFQYDWRGARIQNLRILVCPGCTDTPQENGQRAILIPPDPVPIQNPRPDQHMFMGQSATQNAFQYVAVGKTTSNAPSIITSPDGETWTEAPLSLDDIELFAVAYGNGIWAAVGTVISSPSAVILSSTDGVTWTERSITGFPGPDDLELQCIVFDGSRFITAGYNDDIQATRIFISTDGITWTFLASLNLIEVLGITYGSGLYVVCGLHPATLAPLIRTSEDAITWDVRTVSITSGQLRSVAYGNSSFAAVGFDAVDNVPLILTSPDGVTWTQPSYPLTADMLLNGVASVGGTFVAVGGNETTEADVSVFVSSDNGANWQNGFISVGLVGYPRAITNPNVTIGSVLYPIIFVGGVSKPFLNLSSDGTEWITSGVGAPPNAIYNAVAFGGTG